MTTPRIQEAARKPTARHGTSSSQVEPGGSLFVRCNSHRARERVARLVGPRLYYFSWSRSVGRGCAKVTRAELEAIQAARISGVSRMRKTDDLMRCWNL